MRHRVGQYMMLATGLAVAATPLKAQQWNFDAQAGRIRSALNPEATSAQSITVGIRYDDARTAFRIMGGVPTTSAEPLWGSLSGAKRLAFNTNGFVAGIDLAGSSVLLHDRVQRIRELPGSGLFGQPTQEMGSLSGSAFAGQVMPLIGYERGNVQVYARAGASVYAAKFGKTNRDRTVRMGDLQATLATSTSFMLIPAYRRYEADEGSYSFGGVTAAYAQGPLSVWGTVGSWLGADSAAAPWSAGGSVRVHPHASVNASVRHEGFDPLYLAAPQTSWNAGVSISLGGRRMTGAPIPAKYEAGKATVRLPASSSKSQLSIAGDFNNWKPQPMQLIGKNWTLTIPLKKGVYNFSFVKESGEWFIPEGYPGRKDDGMGGHVAVLVVQ